jgi:hypothetical protein
MGRETLLCFCWAKNFAESVLIYNAAAIGELFVERGLDKGFSDQPSTEVDTANFPRVIVNSQTSERTGKSRLENFGSGLEKTYIAAPSTTDRNARAVIRAFRKVIVKVSSTLKIVLKNKDLPFGDNLLFCYQAGMQGGVG